MKHVRVDDNGRSEVVITEWSWGTEGQTSNDGSSLFVYLDEKGYEVTTGIGEDLFEGARVAVSQMVDLLAGRYNMNAVDAYMLCSVCGDLRISEIVDQPNWLVSFYFPRIVFE